MNPTPPVPGWERIRTSASVTIPTLDGSGVAEMVEVEVDAWRDPETGEVYLDGAATEELDRVKARRLGLLTPDDLRDLRRSLALSQKTISELLQIGEKSWTRWETGRERPSRSMNVLLRALADGRLDVAYLRSLQAHEPQGCGILAFSLARFESPCRYGLPTSGSGAHEAEALAS